ncbi:MAG: histidine triad nucleotide-binding protein [Clostridia bacterium]|nr:histidine triad nucleotide-binding protein [Clostridia bacterium]
MMDCIFCKIVSGEIPSKKAYEDEFCYAFYDVNPKAPIHFLVVPREHIASCDAVTAQNSAAVAHIFEVIPQIVRQIGVTDGYRVISNCGRAAGQTVFHLHFHVLAGTELPW